jgi:hypothetical protein
MDLVLDLERWWRFGGRHGFFVKDAARIRDFIATNKLKPVQGQVATGAALDRAEAAGQRALVVHWPSFPGGMRIAHLHFEDQVYTLTDEQWKTFAGQVMKEFQAKLGQVKTVTFDQLIGIADAVEPLVV